MKDQEKTKKQLIGELEDLRQKVAELQALQTERKKTDEELKKTQVLLKSSIENPKDMIILSIDKQYRYLHFNHTHEETMNHAYNKDTEIGMNLLDCITDGEDRKKAKINFDRALTGEAHTTIEEYGDLERFYYETQYNPILNEKHEIIGATAFATNVTDRKRMEEELEDIFSLSPDMVAVCTTEGKFLKVNPTWEKVLGYTQKELLDLGWGKLVHPDDVERTNEEVEKQLEGSPVVSFVNRYKCKDGSYKTLEWQATFSKDRIVYATARDITDRKKVEENLKLSEEKYRSLIETTDDLIYLVDKNYSYIFMNKKHAERFNLPFKKIIGRSYSEFHSKKESDFFRKDVDKVIRTGRPIKHEHKSERDDKFYFRTYSPLKNEKGKVVAVNVISKDITVLKRVENELKQSELEIHKFTEYLQSAREKERALVASELHDEVGQALTGLKMDIFMIKNKMSKDKKEIPGQFQKMEKLLDDSIQKLRRIYSDLRPSLLDHFGIGEAIRQHVTDFQEQSGTQCTFYQDPEEIILDENRSIALYRIFQGAINNIKWHSQATKVDIKLVERGPNLRLTIRDNGRGIKKEQLNSGKSFGLIGMKERARFLEGKLEIKGLPNKGTTVKLEIPLK